MEVHDGVALINERSIPFELAANNLGAVITYAPATDHYLGEISCSDINARQGNSAAVRSKLDLSLEAAPDEVDLKSLHSPAKKPGCRPPGASPTLPSHNGRAAPPAQWTWRR